MTSPELPIGWAEARLDAAAEVRLGRQRSPKNHSGEDMRPYLRAANLTWEGIDVEDVKEMNFTDAEVDTYRLRDGDVLLSEASGSAKEVGKPGVWRGQSSGDVCFQNTLIRVRPEAGIDSDFLYYRFLYEALRGGFVESSRGVGIHHLGAAKLAALKVEIPPTREQREIVQVLEEVVGELRQQEIELAQLHLRVQALWNRLVDGALVASGPTRRLSELLREPLRNGVSARAVEQGEGIRTFTLTAVTRRDFSVKHSKVTVATREQAAGLWCEPGDVFVQRSNTPELVGSAAVYRGKANFAIFPDLLIRVRPTAELLPDFLEYALRAPAARSYFKSKAQGLAGSMPKISQGTIEAFELSVPDLEDQWRTVTALNLYDTQLEAVSTAIQRLNQLQRRLAQGVLRQAFSGGLVKSEVTDEPGSCVLKKIAAERALRSLARAERQKPGTGKPAIAPRRATGEVVA